MLTGRNHGMPKLFFFFLRGRGGGPTVPRWSKTSVVNLQVLLQNKNGKRVEDVVATLRCVLVLGCRSQLITTGKVKMYNIWPLTFYQWYIYRIFVLMLVSRYLTIYVILLRM